MRANQFRTHTCGELTKAQVGTVVTLSGWVHKKRDHGSLLFIDLRDHYGMTQCVVDLSNEALRDLEKIHNESVITVIGNVVARDVSVINPKLKTGEIEVSVSEYRVQSMAEVLPIQVAGDEKFPEDLRIQYRYIDLRREKLQKNITKRNHMIKWMRDKMWDLGFQEFQTPILTTSSPEGARDFLVPSRLHHGMFYALPQAPQQYKQLIQISGFDRYFQIAPCFRDEDLRADRLLEFYQLDMEMSFVEQEDVFAVGEALIPEMMKIFTDGKCTVDSNIPRIPYMEAIEKYGIDKPDLRNPIIISDVSDVFAKSAFSLFADAVKEGSVVRAIPAPTAGGMARSWFDKMGEFAKEIGLRGLGYLAFADEVKGPIAKSLSESEIESIMKTTGVAKGDAVFFVCEKKDIAAKAAGKIRIRLGEDLKLIDENDYKFCWIVDFPFYELDEETGKVAFSHNPFSMPQGGLDALLNQNPLEIKAFQYDMVLNGAEICSGGLRNYKPEIMVKAFEIAGYDAEVVRKKFGGMWTAFQYGAPQHAGCAFGIDRLVCMACREPNLREVVLFPTNQRGQDLMLGAPVEVSEQQLRELHIQIRKKG